MTPTATKTKTPETAVEQESALRADLDTAKAKLDEIRGAAGEHRLRINQLRGHLNRRLVEHPEDFDATGVAKPKTSAKKLEVEIAQLREADNFNRLLAANEVRVTEAEGALARHRRDHADEMFDEMLPEAEAAVDEWVAAVEALRVPYDKLVVLGQRAVAIAQRSQAYSPRDVPNYESERQTIKALTGGSPMLPLPTHYIAARDAEERRLHEEAEQRETPVIPND